MSKSTKSNEAAQDNGSSLKEALKAVLKLTPVNDEDGEHVGLKASVRMLGKCSPEHRFNLDADCYSLQQERKEDANGIKQVHYAYFDYGYVGECDVAVLQDKISGKTKDIVFGQKITMSNRRKDGTAIVSVECDVFGSYDFQVSKETTVTILSTEDAVADFYDDGTRESIFTDEELNSLNAEFPNMHNEI